MRLIMLMAVGLLVACGSKDKGEDASTSFAAAQAIVDQIASEHGNVQRLTLHAVPAGKDGCTQVASTLASRRGKPSDPEDLQALETGKEVVLDEAGAIDLTVPIRMVDGKPTAVAGVTMKVQDGADRDALLAEARSVAKALEAAIESAKKPLW